jgi:hypothetical protein
MADKYDYSTDSTTNKHEIRRRATKIFFSCGLPLVIIFAPELIELPLQAIMLLCFLSDWGCTYFGQLFFLFLSLGQYEKMSMG